MKLLAEVERRNAAFRDEETKWRQQVEALAETRHQELRRDAREDQKRLLKITIGTAVIGAVIGLIGAIAAAIIIVIWSK